MRALVLRLPALILCAVFALSTACTDTYDYDPATAGAPEGDRAPRYKSNSQFIRSLYADLLGRAPEAHDVTIAVDGVDQFTLPVDEEAQLVGTLDGIGDSLPMRNLIANGLVHGDEVSLPAKDEVDAKTFITDQFRTLLGRDPNPYELQVFANEWASDDAVGPTTIIRAIVGSREYQSQ